MGPRDPTLDVLLDLDGQVLVVDPEGEHYEYQDAATLLADFWNTVDAVLREKGVIS